MSAAHNAVGLDELLSHWELASVEVTELTGGEQKRVWRLDSGDAQYALRLYPAFVPRESVHRECLWLTQMADSLPEIPRPLPTRRGALFVEAHGRCAAVAPYIVGAPVDAGIRGHRKAMASTLARIHHAARHLDTSGRSVHPALRDLDWHANHWWDIGAIERGPSGAELWEVTKPRLPQVPRWLEALDGLPECIIHNDYGVVNVLMHDGAVAGVIDWDWTTVDWRMLDLGHAIRTVSRRGWKFDLNVAQQFIDDYQRGGESLKTRELDALPDLLRLQITWVALYDLGRACDGRLDLDSERYRIITTASIDSFAAELAELA